MSSFFCESKPFIIAEIGANHEGDVEYAKKLASKAIAAGADAVKFQTYSPDRIVSKVVSPERHKHFAKFALEMGSYMELARMCIDGGVEFMTSLWDLESLRELDPYIQTHKVGSGDLTNYRLLKPLAETGKRLCLATAMSEMAEVLAAVEFVGAVNPELVESGKLCVMQCVAMYGNPKDQFANLLAIEALRDSLPSTVAVGYSDHTMGGVAAITAACMGVRAIETHFTDDNRREFRDHHFAHTPDELRELVHFCERRSALLGAREKRRVSDVETLKRQWEFRRAVYFNRDMKAGEVATEETLTTLRPAEGISALHYFDVIGQKLVVDKLAFESVSWRDFEGAF